mmetsp:Transcript_39439/g.94234  ORF Transcript_39439/g.94234 Transcript_39439/m.94234 type:complete len:361 (+) Transcript_39439:264-1346(+)
MLGDPQVGSSEEPSNIQDLMMHVTVEPGHLQLKDLAVALHGVSGQRTLPCRAVLLYERHDLSLDHIQSEPGCQYGREKPVAALLLRWEGTPRLSVPEVFLVPLRQFLQVRLGKATQHPMTLRQGLQVLVGDDDGNLQDLGLLVELVEAAGGLQVDEDEVRAPRLVAVAVTLILQSVYSPGGCFLCTVLLVLRAGPSIPLQAQGAELGPHLLQALHLQLLSLQEAQLQALRIVAPHIRRELHCAAPHLQRALHLFCEPSLALRSGLLMSQLQLMQVSRLDRLPAPLLPLLQHGLQGRIRLRACQAQVAIIQSRLDASEQLEADGFFNVILCLLDGFPQFSASSPPTAETCLQHLLLHRCGV